ncbi:MAG: NAD(P)H-dependent oxidoreductase subunit E, partial [Anaerolineales bacterium]
MEVEKLAQITEKENARTNEYEHHVRVCAGSGCMSSDSEGIIKAMKATVKERKTGKLCDVKGVGCMGLCGEGPIVSIDHDRVMYQHVTVGDAERIIDSLKDDDPIPDIHCPSDTDFFTKQIRIVREHAGYIDPERIEEYIAVGGYSALYKALTEYMPDGLVLEVMHSGLRGRGGAGYPTGLKWGTVAKAPGSPKYIICNGDEGDPGAFMDRSIMESDPHLVIEGMAIAGYAVGASQGYIYVRAEYPLAI